MAARTRSSRMRRRSLLQTRHPTLRVSPSTKLVRRAPSAAPAVCAVEACAKAAHAVEWILKHAGTTQSVAAVNVSTGSAAAVGRTDKVAVATATAARGDVPGEFAARSIPRARVVAELGNRARRRQSVVRVASVTVVAVVGISLERAPLTRTVARERVPVVCALAKTRVGPVRTMRTAAAARAGRVGAARRGE